MSTIVLKSPVEMILAGWLCLSGIWFTLGLFHRVATRLSVIADRGHAHFFTTPVGRRLTARFQLFWLAHPRTLRLTRVIPIVCYCVWAIIGAWTVYRFLTIGVN